MRPVQSVIAVLWLAVFVAPGLAEKSPEAYGKMQREAAEALRIKVRTIRTDETDESYGKRIEVTVEAVVEKVVRSRTALRTGDLIRIQYVHTRNKEVREGAGEVPILVKGKTYPAYLTGGDFADEKEKGYFPAAGSFTFREIR